MHPCDPNLDKQTVGYLLDPLFPRPRAPLTVVGILVFPYVSFCTDIFGAPSRGISAFVRIGFNS